MPARPIAAHRSMQGRCHSALPWSMDLTSVERFERQTHKSVCRTQARRHRASITITALRASKRRRVVARAYNVIGH
jgi:hypothetical protein